MRPSTVESSTSFLSEARRARPGQWWERFLTALLRALAGYAT
jgi:hypothetical protein